MDITKANEKIMKVLYALHLKELNFWLRNEPVWQSIYKVHNMNVNPKVSFTKELKFPPKVEQSIKEAEYALSTEGLILD